MSKRPTISRRFFAGMTVVCLFASGCQNKPTQSQNERPFDSQLADVPQDAQAMDPSREPVDPAKLGTAEARRQSIDVYVAVFERDN